MSPIHPYIARLLVDEHHREVGSAAARARLLDDLRRAKRSARAHPHEEADLTAA
jgi:hypothetical protein